jgi:hypothetical protein
MTKLEKVKKLAEISLFDASIHKVVSGIFGAMGFSPDEQLKVDIVLEEAKKDLLNRFHLLKEEHYSEEYLDSMIAFYESPLGLEFIANSKKLEQLTVPINVEWQDKWLKVLKKALDLD